VIEQIVFGLRASMTSARTGVVEPCITNSASWVDGAPGQVPFIAAHAGTATGLADGEGDGEGVGLGDGLGEAEGVEPAEGDWDGVECAAAGPFAEQPAAASRTPMSTNPLLMRG